MSKSGDLESLLEFDFATAVDALDHYTRATPDRQAVLYGETGECFSFARFGRLTDNVAGNLASLGVGKGDRIGVLTTDPLVAAITMYGAWKAGAVYAPANFQYTGDLLAYQLNDSAPAVLVVGEDLRSVVADIEDRLVSPPRIITADSFDGGDFAALLRDAPRPEIRVEFSDPANIIYTSGTTGPSKGVVQSHRWLNVYTWIGRQTLTPDDVVYDDLPMYHIAGAHITFARALWAGASVSLWKRFSPKDFWNRIKDTGCTTAILLDVMIPWLVNAEPSDDDRNNPLNKVHLQPLPANHHEFAARFGIDFTTAGFGQSESGLSLLALTEQLPEGQGTPPELYRGLSHAQLRDLFTANDLPVLDGTQTLPKGFMGTALPFTEVTVLDERDRECAPGVVGQLAMRPRLPEALFQEYLGKPEATVKAWRNLWFHTGDAAICDAEGMFYFVDRLGDRLRVRGENISSFHVEEILVRHDSIQLSAVVAVPSQEGDEDDVIAFVELAEGAEYDADAVREHCLRNLPKFMRPREVIPVDQMPRTATNKIEKYKLRNSYLERRRLDAESARTGPGVG
ncbi:AMP-binding protein [Rhodococcus sp. CSLK01-03]|uniref:AMP-binding protein n=2 Tax=Rhodococcus indonesiensis TaxID=3055869 RepID=A0ABT7RTJ8_9NOCA|nr:AMP-binding protein [Rhodococcus indonesiensis]